ncbi:MAG: alpha/beta fold hydrolase [Chlamydiota bacterium]
MQSLIFLHGFLGCPDDWDEVISHLPQFHCTPIAIPQEGAIVEQLRHHIRTAFPQKPHCIGYSMGGRIALQLTDLCASTTALSAHPGLKGAKEREQRWLLDTIWIDQLRTLPFDLFLERWYAQPLFASLHNKPDLLQKIMSRRIHQNPERLASMLEQLSLAKQPLVSPAVLSSTCFVFGEEDWKYRALCDKLAFVKMIPHAGHAIHLEKPAECAHTIKEVIDAHTRK